MIYVTGDTHIPEDISKLNTKGFPEQKKLTKNDYLIICGDFGGVWDNGREDLYWRRWLDSKKFTTLFVDGNHENFEILNTFPVVDIFGGKAHKVGESIYHLMRGEIYEIEGHTFFTMGGAASHDKELRTEGVNWWKEELPDKEEMKHGWEMLKKSDFKVDYIITHCAPDIVQALIAPGYKPNQFTYFLRSILGRVEYKKWFFGHYHIDRIMGNNIAVFNSIIPLNQNVR